MFPGRRQKRRVTPFVTEVLMHWSRSNFMVRVSDFTPGDQNDLVFLIYSVIFCITVRCKNQWFLKCSLPIQRYHLGLSLPFRKKFHFEINQYSMICFFFKVQIKQGPRRMWGLHFASQKKFSNYLCSIFKSLLGTCLYCISDRYLNINIPFHIQGLQCGNKNHYVSLKSKLRFLSVDMKDTASKK